MVYKACIKHNIKFQRSHTSLSTPLTRVSVTLGNDLSVFWADDDVGETILKNAPEFGLFVFVVLKNFGK